MVPVGAYDPPMLVPPRAGLVGMAIAFAVDGLLLPLHPRRAVTGAVDEAAHLGTGLAVLAAWPRPDAEFAAGLAAGSVLIDADHLPELWGSSWLRPRGIRPYPHCLLTPAFFLWRGRTSRAALGAGVGLSAHLVRDLATGISGVPLLWPLSSRPFSIRYPVYAALLAALAARGVRDPARGSESAPVPASASA